MKRRKPSRASKLKTLRSKLAIAEGHVRNLQMAIHLMDGDVMTFNAGTSFTRLPRCAHLSAPYRNR